MDPNLINPAGCRYGGLVARHPVSAIALCLLLPGLSAIGLLRYRAENNPYKLWIPQVTRYGFYFTNTVFGLH